SYWDWQGREVTVSDETLAAIVAVLENTGLDNPGLDNPGLDNPGLEDARAGEAPGADAAALAAEAVAPAPAERTWGFAVQLYSLRSRGSWGHGDLRDLADLATWSARDLGAGFVLINPLHA